MALLICVSLIIFTLGTYIIWPSRQNVVTHLGIGFSFVAYIIPALIVNVTDKYNPSLVEQYTEILAIGAISYLFGLILGFKLKKSKTHFTFEVLPAPAYEKKVVKLTKTLVIIGIIGLLFSFLVMGFVPLFAKDPISAKFFRGMYQAPYQRVAVLYRSSLFILSTIIPIAIMIWYETKSKSFIWLTVLSITLIALTLLRSLAFTGIVFAFAIIMSFKRIRHFYILVSCLVGIYMLSALVYFLVGIKDLDTGSSLNQRTNIWETIASGSPDIEDQLNFLAAFNDEPVWTYGRTWYGGLIPGHYKWNPGVYTLNIVVKDTDINEIDSGGLRLPVALWGYVSFEWIGVILVCFFSGMIKGWFIRFIKAWIEKYDSLIIKTIVLLVFSNLFSPLSEFYILSMYSIPIFFILIFYLYRFKLKSNHNLNSNK